MSRLMALVAVALMAAPVAAADAPPADAPPANADAAETERLLGMALAEARLGQCAEALVHVDAYLARVAAPSREALVVLKQCPRGAPAAPTTAPLAAPTTAPSAAPSKPAAPPAPSPPASSPPASSPVAPSSPSPAPSPRSPAPSPAPSPSLLSPPPPAPPAPKPKPKRAHVFLLEIGIGLNVPLTSDTQHLDFLGLIELGVPLSNKIGLDLVLIAESLVSRTELFEGSTNQTTVFTENLLLGLEVRRLVWRRLSLFGTIAAGIAVDSFNGFIDAAALHLDVGAGWTLGPGDLRVRPLDFSFLVNDNFGAAWRATIGYALRF